MAHTDEQLEWTFPAQPTRAGGTTKLAAEVVMVRGFHRFRVWLSIVVTLTGLAASAMAGRPNLAEGAAPEETAVFAGGCFWGVQGVFQRVKGVTRAVSGYSGGEAGSAQYEAVSRGTTGHAESVQVVYDPARISYAQLLEVFFTVVHDPTQLNRQGPDVGTQYRSAIFYATPAQKAAAQAYIEQLTAAKTFRKAIVTQVVPLAGFYPAEAYHQDYLNHHPDDPYIVYHDWPKITALQKQFPSLYVAR
jgi:peptide-methionine (S)-S-oxide reductase